METPRCTDGTRDPVADAVAHLASEFGPLIDHEVIERILEETVSDFRSARAPAYVPVLVERLGRQRLVAWLKAHGPALPAQRAQVRQA